MRDVGFECCVSCGGGVASTWLVGCHLEFRTVAVGSGNLSPQWLHGDEGQREGHSSNGGVGTGACDVSAGGSLQQSLFFSIGSIIKIEPGEDTELSLSPAASPGAGSDVYGRGPILPSSLHHSRGRPGAPTLTP